MNSSKYGEIDGEGVCGNANRPGCGQVIWWVKTRRGKSMPVNEDDTCHWETCPKAENFRPNDPSKRTSPKPPNVQMTGEILDTFSDGTARIKLDSPLDITRNVVQVALRLPPKPPEDDLPF